MIRAPTVAFSEFERRSVPHASGVVDDLLGELRTVDAAELGVVDEQQDDVRGLHSIVEIGEGDIGPRSKVGRRHAIDRIQIATGRIQYLKEPYDP